MELIIEDIIKNKLLKYKHSNEYFEIFVSVELIDGTKIQNVKLIKYWKAENKNNHFEENPFDEDRMEYEEIFRKHTIGLNYVSKIKNNENEIIEEFWERLGDYTGEYDFQNEDGYFSPYHIFTLQMNDDKYFNYKIARDNINSKHLLSFPDNYSYSNIKNLLEINYILMVI